MKTVLMILVVVLLAAILVTLWLWRTDNPLEKDPLIRAMEKNLLKETKPLTAAEVTELKQMQQQIEARLLQLANPRTPDEAVEAAELKYRLLQLKQTLDRNARRRQ